MSPHPRSYSSDDGRFHVVLPDDVEHKILRLCGATRGRETGGVLVGNYTPNRETAIITDATPPPWDSNAGRTWFNRGVAGLHRLFVRLWSKPNREYYIGEWHHHPTDTIAMSTDDVRQMINISEDGNYRCPEPVLIIVGSDRSKRWNAKVFIFPQKEKPTELVEHPT